MPHTDIITRREYQRTWKRAHPQQRTPEQLARHRLAVKAWAARPENKAKRKLQARTREKYQKYGMTEEAYKSMLGTQRGVCAICGGINDNGWELYIDHDHATGKVRGLLCHKCNVSLGLTGEKISTLENMIKYLNERAEK